MWCVAKASRIGTVIYGSEKLFYQFGYRVGCRLPLLANMYLLFQNFLKLLEGVNNFIQVALVIRGLFICKFTYSHWQNWSKLTIFLSKMAFLNANSGLAVQNEGKYLQRITRETCTELQNKILYTSYKLRILLSLHLRQYGQVPESML